MKRVISLILSGLMLICLFGCGDSADGLIDPESATLNGLRLGMSVDKSGKSGVFDEQYLEYRSKDGIIPYDPASVQRGKGVEYLGEDCALQMYFSDGKLISAQFEVNMNMDERGIDFSQREEFFNEKTALVENSLKEALGEATYELKTSLTGGVYPREDDYEAWRQVVYFIKDGKVLPSGNLVGSKLSEYYNNTDYDYVISSFCVKGVVYTENDFDTTSNAGMVIVQIATKEAAAQS